MTPPRRHRTWPLVGDLPALAADPLGFFSRLSGLGEVVPIRLAGRPAYVVTTQALVRRILVADYHSFDKGGPFIDKVRLFVGNGVATCGRADHLRQRRLLQPAFHRDHLPGYTSVMEDCAKEMTSRWRDGARVDVNQEMYRVSAEVMIRVWFSDEGGAAAADTVERVLPTVLDSLYWQMLLPTPLRRIVLPRRTRAFERACRELDEAAYAMVRNGRSTSGASNDLVSLVMSRNGEAEMEGFTDAEMRDQIITFLSGGVETTTAVMAWALHLLARHPECEERLAAEAESGGDSYARAVIAETLRLYPPVWVMTRKVTHDVEMGGVTIPAGADVVYSPYALQRDPAVFADPGSFDPGRWEDADRALHDAVFPFGAGARRCMGDSFAIAQAAVVLSAVAREWRLRPVSARPVAPVPRMTLTPSKQLMLTQRRTG